MNLTREIENDLRRKYLVTPKEGRDSRGRDCDHTSFVVRRDDYDGSG